MKSTAARVFLIAFAAAALAGCTIHPLYNVKDAPIDTPTGMKRTVPDVEKAIRSAGALTGWRMQMGRPGLISAATSWGGHTAMVEITYNLTSYSITYKDSVALSYDGTSIHRNYNRKVQELDKAIQAQLAAF